MQHLQKHLVSLTNERQWLITQARKGNITETDMQMQLAELQAQEGAYRREFAERLALTAARQQAEALNTWANQYLSEIHAGITVLDVDVVKLTSEQREALGVTLESWRFAEKFPGDTLAQLRWAILEEKRRVVRTLIDRVLIERVNAPNKRKITPILALDLPAEFVSLVSSDQSIDYIEQVGRA